MIHRRFGLPLAAVAAAVAVCALPVRGQEAKGPEVGQMAPDFSLPDQTGTIRHLADYRGKTVILAFYPKDFTGG